MIDTILILLIFYMSFSTFSATEKRLDHRLPQFGNGADGMDLVVHVRNEREIVVNGNVVDPASFSARLLTLRGTTVPVSVLIEAEPTTSYQAVINVLDACAAAKLTRVAFRPLG